MRGALSEERQHHADSDQCEPDLLRSLKRPTASRGGSSSPERSCPDLDWVCVRLSSPANRRSAPCDRSSLLATRRSDAPRRPKCLRSMNRPSASRGRMSRSEPGRAVERPSCSVRCERCLSGCFSPLLSSPLLVRIGIRHFSSCPVDDSTRRRGCSPCRTRNQTYEENRNCHAKNLLSTQSHAGHAGNMTAPWQR